MRASPVLPSLKALVLPTVNIRLVLSHQKVCASLTGIAFRDNGVRVLLNVALHGCHRGMDENIFQVYRG